MKLLDGKLVSDTIKAEIAAEVKSKMLDLGINTPHLAAVLVGEDPASQTYVAAKEKDCKEVGFISSIYRYPASISQKKLLEVIDFLTKILKLTDLLSNYRFLSTLMNKSLLKV